MQVLVRHKKPWATNDKTWELYRSKMSNGKINNNDSLKIINKKVLILLKNT